MNLTDEAVKDVAHKNRFAQTQEQKMLAELAMALLDARAERDALFRRATLAEEWRDHDKTRADTLAAEVVSLKAQMAELEGANNSYQAALQRHGVDGSKGPEQ